MLKSEAESYFSLQANYLESWRTPKYGLFKLAVMYSLPFGMLMWRYCITGSFCYSLKAYSLSHICSAIMFALAVAYLTFFGAQKQAPWFILGTLVLITVLLCTWTVFQFERWSALVRVVRVWEWFPHKSVAEEDRAPIAKAITKAHKAFCVEYRKSRCKDRAKTAGSENA